MIPSDFFLLKVERGKYTRVNLILIFHFLYVNLTVYFPEKKTDWEKNSGSQPFFLPQYTWKKGDNLTVAFYTDKKGSGLSLRKKYVWLPHFLLILKPACHHVSIYISEIPGGNSYTNKCFLFSSDTCVKLFRDKF